jgi:hypothetical protein
MLRSIFCHRVSSFDNNDNMYEMFNSLYLIISDLPSIHLSPSSRAWNRLSVESNLGALLTKKVSQVIKSF